MIEGVRKAFRNIETKIEQTSYHVAEEACSTSPNKPIANIITGFKIKEDFIMENMKKFFMLKKLPNEKNTINGTSCVWSLDIL